MAAPLSTQQLFYLFLVVLLPIATHGSASAPLLYQTCGQNFTENTILDVNIESILLDMVAKSSLNGYAISNFASEGCEAVYGVTRCQADMSARACSACIASAAQKVRSTCPASAESRIWYEDCFLHYDTKNFIGKPENNIVSVWFSPNAAANPNEFIQAVGGLMGEVMAETAGGSRKFGYGEDRVDHNLKVYGMAQCTRDLAESGCLECLGKALEVMADYCGTREGCRIFGSSCAVRYETYKFYSFTDDDAAAAAPAPSPPYKAGC